MTRAAVRFFATNDGGIVGQCWLGALHLARAEAYAEAQGWAFEWEGDDCWTLDDDEHARYCAGARLDAHEGRRQPFHCEHAGYVCLLKDEEGHVLASLCGIVDPSREYIRIVTAELASEAMAEIEAREREDARAGSYLAL
jgi:hypothetical protein